MKLPNSFIPKKDLEKEMRRLQNLNHKTVKSASDLVLEGRIPCDYVLDEKTELSSMDIRSTYSFMIPMENLESNLRINYKFVNSQGGSQDLRVDVFEFKDEHFVSKNIEKFYQVEQKLNSSPSSSVLHKMLIKKQYVAFFRAPWNINDILGQFIQEYKTRFEMKEVAFTLK